MSKLKNISKIRKDPENLNEKEEKVVESQQAKVEEENNSGDISAKRLNKVTEVVQDLFNLKDKGYAVISFKDANKVVIQVENSEFNLSIVVKDPTAYGIGE